MSWDTSGGGGDFADIGNNDKTEFDQAYKGGLDGGNDMGGPSYGSNDGGCFNCGEQGHMKSDCPNPRVARENKGACYNCGEAGHNKSECTNPAAIREFTGECRVCCKTGHRASDCPDAPPKICGNCGKEGHVVFGCPNPRLINRDGIDEVMPEVAWNELRAAILEKDMDDIHVALEKYVKALPDTTFIDLEGAFRKQKLSLYVIGLTRELAPTYTNMDLQGNLDREFTVSYRYSPKPRRPIEAQNWPASEEENLERLKNAGTPVDRGVPRCHNCTEVGHTSKTCPQEKNDPVAATVVNCYNCSETGHRVRDCPLPRLDRFACRNCKQSGHSSKECPEPRSAEGVECKKCGETGHFARDCPTSGGGDGPCRNCDEVGHKSRECPKPRDYSRVKCSNCGEMGHTKVRCRIPAGEAVIGNDSDGKAIESPEKKTDPSRQENIAPSSALVEVEGTWGQEVSGEAGW